MAKIQTKVDFRLHEHLLTSLGNPLVYRLLRTGTLCRNLPSQRLKALKHHSRASCPGPTRNCAQPVGFMSHRTLRLSSRSRSRSYDNVVIAESADYDLAPIFVGTRASAVTMIAQDGRCPNVGIMLKNVHWTSDGGPQGFYWALKYELKVKTMILYVSYLEKKRKLFLF